MDSKGLYDALKKIQEAKGFFFNPDSGHVFGILDALLVNKNRYGYMACPCRLAADDKNHDKDIICPCAYREADVKEFGSCYCGLYVSADWINGKIKREYVPERRPAEKTNF